MSSRSSGPKGRNAVLHRSTVDLFSPAPSEPEETIAGTRYTRVRGGMVSAEQLFARARVPGARIGTCAYKGRPDRHGVTLQEALQIPVTHVYVLVPCSSAAAAVGASS